jgi:glutamyl/glutaminyl-tRNA synthetase
MKDLFDVLREPKHCYCNKEQIDELREKQMAAGECVRYDDHLNNTPRQMMLVA